MVGILVVIVAFVGGVVGWQLSSYYSAQRGKISQLVAYIEQLEEALARRPPAKPSSRYPSPSVGAF